MCALATTPSSKGVTLVDESPATPDIAASEITYDEEFYPRRTRPARPSIRRQPLRVEASRGEPTGENPLYQQWLVSQSMLADANVLASQLAGHGSMWQNPYANPDPVAASA